MNFKKKEKIYTWLAVRKRPALVDNKIEVRVEVLKVKADFDPLTKTEFLDGAGRPVDHLQGHELVKDNLVLDLADDARLARCFQRD